MRFNNVMMLYIIELREFCGTASGSRMLILTEIRGMDFDLIYRGIFTILAC